MGMSLHGGEWRIHASAVDETRVIEDSLSWLCEGLSEIVVKKENSTLGAPMQTISVKMKGREALSSLAKVEAFREAEQYLVIDPDECIDCAACIPECPEEAIYADTDLPDEEMEWLEKNEVESPDLPIAEGDSPVLADS